jgi:hypothetical protein
MNIRAAGIDIARHCAHPSLSAQDLGARAFHRTEAIMSIDLALSPVASTAGFPEEQRLMLFDAALVLEPAAPGSWRVREDRSSTELARFLAFIQEQESGFEVMQVADKFTWSTFPTMRAALVHVALTSRASLVARSGSDLAWLR